jgi:nucleoside triphosphate pyrophosphatase
VVYSGAVVTTKLILASASPRRAEILHNAGYAFAVVSSAIDETPIPSESAEAMVQRLADAKAELVAARSVGPAIVVAADTAVLIGTQILGKPRTTEDARQMLQSLSGMTHSVITGVSLVRLPDVERRSFVEATQVYFAPMTTEEIEEYLATGEPFDKAGGYAIQGRAGRFIPRIEGCYFNVVGLPLARLARELRELGYHPEMADAAGM